MVKQYEAMANANLYLKVKASDKTEAKNKVLEVFDKMKDYAQMDVNSLDIIETAKNES